MLLELLSLESPCEITDDIDFTDFDPLLADNFLILSFN